MSPITCFVLALTVLVLTVECSVIRVNKVPLTDGVVMKVVVNEDPGNKGSAVATIKIAMEKEDGHNRLVKPTGDVPPIEDRLLIKSSNCPLGQVRVGPVCV
ncbi:hypothetical protein KGM_206962 [Danaus plexippus plexippus]|uniref:Uncharacterized protein n=1 Tax=Danaus plexippus plexippus TaxID=278856 RepID=A0A212EN63_DANPL|nr:hypothetical protein KGM_206962 [Danaus plexippus plexippus]